MILLFIVIFLFSGIFLYAGWTHSTRRITKLTFLKQSAGLCFHNTSGVVKSHAFVLAGSRIFLFIGIFLFCSIFLYAGWTLSTRRITKLTFLKQSSRLCFHDTSGVVESHAFVWTGSRIFLFIVIFLFSGIFLYAGSTHSTRRIAKLTFLKQSSGLCFHNTSGVVK